MALERHYASHTHLGFLLGFVHAGFLVLILGLPQDSHVGHRRAVASWDAESTYRHSR